MEFFFQYLVRKFLLPFRPNGEYNLQRCVQSVHSTNRNDTDRTQMNDEIVDNGNEIPINGDVYESDRAVLRSASATAQSSIFYRSPKTNMLNVVVTNNNTNKATASFNNRRSDDGLSNDYVNDTCDGGDGDGNGDNDDVDGNGDNNDVDMNDNVNGDVNDGSGAGAGGGQGEDDGDRDGIDKGVADDNNANDKSENSNDNGNSNSNSDNDDNFDGIVDIVNINNKFYNESTLETSNVPNSGLQDNTIGTGAYTDTGSGSGTDNNKSTSSLASWGLFSSMGRSKNKSATNVRRHSNSNLALGIQEEIMMENLMALKGKYASRSMSCTNKNNHNHSVNVDTGMPEQNGDTNNGNSDSYNNIASSSSSKT